jgi:hypothetical protein
MLVADLTIFQRATKLTVSLTTGIEDLNISGIKIYPNPTGGILYVEMDKVLPAKSKIVLTDINGKVVLNKVFEDMIKQELNLTHLSKGMYFLQLQNRSSRHFQKIIIQ